MKDFEGKVAVVTGAASGIGRAIAEKCLAEGMNVVMADIEKDALDRTASELQSGGTNSILPVPTDVAILDQLENLADRAFDEFGAVHLLFNNAGVGGGGNAWTATEKDWKWVLGVNLMSVIHGVRIFVPRMIAQDTECHVVNTASIAGLLTATTNACYAVTKHGVVAFTEILSRDLEQENTKIHCSVLCPGFVNTNIFDSGRNRPDHLMNEGAPTEISAEDEQRIAMFREVLKQGMQPSRLAEIVFDGIRNDQLYLLTHDQFDDLIRARAENIVTGTNPVIFNLFG